MSRPKDALSTQGRKTMAGKVATKRNRLGLSQADLSKLCGKSAGWVGQLEMGERATSRGYKLALERLREYELNGGSVQAKVKATQERRKPREVKPFVGDRLITLNGQVYWRADAVHELITSALDKAFSTHE